MHSCTVVMTSLFRLCANHYRPTHGAVHACPEHKPLKEKKNTWTERNFLRNTLTEREFKSPCTKKEKGPPTTKAFKLVMRSPYTFPSYIILCYDDHSMILSCYHDHTMMLLNLLHEIIHCGAQLRLRIHTLCCETATSKLASLVFHKLQTM